MKKPIYIICLGLLFSTGFVFGQDEMTPERFLETVNAPADAVPLIPQLAKVPIWTNAVASNIMIFASGGVFQEKMARTAHTVRGKFLIFTEQSKLYTRPMNTILTFDEKASALKAYVLHKNRQGSDIITEGSVAYNFATKTYAITVSSQGNITETTKGSYTDTEENAKTVIYKDGVLFLTREVTTWPVTDKSMSP